jgi:hypothetical protein
MTEDAERVYNQFINGSDSFPQAGTYWFRDWFYPLWEDHGGAQVMANFFHLVGEHFEGGSMNWGEYVHFTSAAAGTDLKALATEAFGWPAERESQWTAARSTYSELEY